MYYNFVLFYSHWAYVSLLFIINAYTHVFQCLGDAVVLSFTATSVLKAIKSLLSANQTFEQPNTDFQGNNFWSSERNTSF